MTIATLQRAAKSLAVRFGLNWSRAMTDQRCVLAPDLESILRSWTIKIHFRQHRPIAAVMDLPAAKLSRAAPP